MGSVYGIGGDSMCCNTILNVRSQEAGDETNIQNAQNVECFCFVSNESPHFKNTNVFDFIFWVFFE